MPVSDPLDKSSLAVPSEKASLRASVMLTLAMLAWGMAFPLLKNWQNHSPTCPHPSWQTANPLVQKVISSATLIMLRMFLALVLLAVFRPRLFTQPSRREHAFGALIGFVFFIGFLCQVVGIAGATPALSAFITSLLCIWVPLLAWLCWRAPITLLTLAGLGLGMGGVVVLSFAGTSEGTTQWWGVGLTLATSFFFAVHVLLLDRLGRKASQPAHLTVGLLGSTGVLALLAAGVGAAVGPGLSAWLDWTAWMSRDPFMVRDLGLLTVFSTVLAIHWMNVYQPLISATRAALIYLTEPVFAAIFSIAWGHDPFSLYLVLGGGIILGGNLLVELPGMLRLRNAQRMASEGRTPNSGSDFARDSISR